MGTWVLRLGALVLGLLLAGCPKPSPPAEPATVAIDWTPGTELAASWNVMGLVPGEYQHYGWVDAGDELLQAQFLSNPDGASLMRLVRVEGSTLATSESFEASALLAQPVGDTVWIAASTEHALSFLPVDPTALTFGTPLALPPEAPGALPLVDLVIAGLLDPGDGTLALVVNTWTANAEQPQGRVYRFDPVTAAFKTPVILAEAIPPTGVAELEPGGGLIVYPARGMRTMGQRFELATGGSIKTPLADGDFPSFPKPVLDFGDSAIRILPSPLLYDPPLRLGMGLANGADGRPAVEGVYLFVSSVPSDFPLELRGDLSVSMQHQIEQAQGSIERFSAGGVRLYEFDGDRALVLQVLRPSPAEINEGHGIVRIGLLDPDAMVLDWEASVQLPEMEPGLALPWPGISVHTEGDTWMFGLRMALPNPSAPNTPHEWAGWTRMTVPVELRTTREGWRPPASD